MPAWDGEETAEVSCLGDGGTDGEGLLGIWDTTDGGLLVPIPGMNVVVLRQRLDGNGTEPPEVAGKMGTAVEDLGKGGSGYENNREVLCGGGAKVACVWVCDVGSDPPVGEIP